MEKNFGKKAMSKFKDMCSIEIWIELVMDSLGCVLWVHNILTAVMMFIVVL